MTISILIVDDHPVVRAGLEGLLHLEDDMAVVGVAASGADALRLVASLAPDVVLMDLRMPGDLDGVDAIERLAAMPEPPKVLVLTTYSNDGDIVRAVAAGATGYLLKDAPREELALAIRSVARGETALAPDVAAKLASHVRRPPPALSAREREVLTLVAAGGTNADVARQMYVAEATVKTYLVRIFAKLNVDDRTAAVAKALALGLIRL